MYENLKKYISFSHPLKNNFFILIFNNRITEKMNLFCQIKYKKIKIELFKIILWI